MNYQELLQNVRNKDTIFFMDLAWHLHRYYYALRHMHRPGDPDQPIGHVYGVLRELISIKKNYPNSAVVFCQDGIPVRRMEVEPEYKAGRKELEYNIWQDVESLLHLCCTVPDVYVAGRKDLEADDVMFSLAKRLERDVEDMPIYIFSGDNDMLQAVTDRVFVVRKISKTGVMELYDAARVQDKYNGVAPESLPTFRSIIGDKSDNLPGLYRFPRKLAKQICDSVQELSDIETLELEGLTPAMQKHLASLQDNMELVRKNYSLMRLRIEETISIERASNEDKAMKCVDHLRIKSLPSFFDISIA